MDIETLINLITTLAATFIGAYLAFKFEKKNRDDDEKQKQVGAANRALYTLFNFWNILEQFRKDIIEPQRGRPDAWLSMAATPVTSSYGLTAFEAGELSFLLQIKDSMMVFAELLLEEQRFKQVINMIELRSSIILDIVHPSFAAEDIKIGTMLEEPVIEKIVGIDNVHKLKVLEKDIVTSIDTNLKSIIVAHDQLRAAMKSLYPKQTFINIEFGIVQTPAS